MINLEQKAMIDMVGLLFFYLDPSHSTIYGKEKYTDITDLALETLIYITENASSHSYKSYVVPKELVNSLMTLFSFN